MRNKQITKPAARVHGINNYLKEINDPRDNRGKKYDKDYVLELFVVGMLYGAKDVSGVEQTLRIHKDEIGEFIDLSPGIPSHDCFSDLLAMINPDEMEQVLVKHCDQLLDKKEGRQLIFDGTAVRGARSKRNGESLPPYILNSVEGSSKLVTSACLVGKKENENVAMLRELQKTDVSGAVVSADALNNTCAIMNLLVEDLDSHFVFPFKDDHPELKRLTLETLVSKMHDHLVKKRNHKIYQAPKPELSRDFDISVTCEKQHGRLEIRKLYLTNDVSAIDLKLYPHIKQIGIYEKTTVTYTKDKDGNDVPHCEHSWCAVATDMKDADANEINKRKRCNWICEAFHWLKDNYLLEDRQTTTKGESLANFAIIRRIVYNLLVVLGKIAPETEEMSIPNKTQWLSVNFSYIFMLVFGYVSEWREIMLHFHQEQCRRFEADIEENKETAPPLLLKIEAKEP